MEKAVIYARYSSDKQTEQSIEGQVRECEIFAKAKNLSIIGKYVDRAMTGKADKRPDFQRLVKDSAKGLFDYVIVYQLDRFARNRFDSAHYKHLLKKNGVKVLSAKENIADDPSGILMETVLEGMAEYYSAELAQKVKRGMYEGFLKGHTSGSGCYGYDLIPVDPSNSNSKTKKFVVNKAESEIVRQVFDMYVGGKTLKEIRTWLQVNNIKNKQGKIYHLNTITRMITNPKYIGTLTFGEQVRENAIPPIVDKEIFEQAQRRAVRNKKNVNSFKSKERYLLSMKTICGFCKKPIAADSGTSKQGHMIRYYKCYTKKKLGLSCDKVQHGKDKLEFGVVRAIMNKLQEQGMIEMIAKQIVEYNNEMQTNPKLEHYESQLRECGKSLDNIMRAVEQGLFNSKTQERMLQLESEKADLIFRIDGEKLDVPIKLNELELIFWFKQFIDGDVNDEKHRERLIDTFINKIILWNEKAYVTFNIKGVDGSNLTFDEIVGSFQTKSEQVKGSTHSHLVTHPGLEPGTTSLKVRCSTN